MLRSVFVGPLLHLQLDGRLHQFRYGIATSDVMDSLLDLPAI